jgi:hypothetical protein
MRDEANGHAGSASGGEVPCPREHLLYSRLEERLGAGAHSHYNSLLRRMDSYAHALERERSYLENSKPNFTKAKT